MDDKQLQLSTSQSNTLRRIISDIKEGIWRYNQPPASRYPKRTLAVLERHGLVKLVYSPMYLEHGDKIGKGVKVTEKGNALFNF